MKKEIRQIVKLMLIERIKRMSATKNAKDSKYPISLEIDVYPTDVNTVNTLADNYRDIINNMIQGRNEKNTKTISVQGDYAKQGSTGVKTLRLKISRSDWPDEWRFPINEIERRLFLQNFRIQNLDIISPYDEGGTEYENIFSNPDANISVEFEESEESEESEERENISQSERAETISSILSGFDFIIADARENNEIEYSNMVHEAMLLFIKEITKR